MKYVENNLTKDEVVIEHAHLHWLIYGKAIIFLVLSILSANTDSDIGALFMFFALVFFIDALIKRYTTELAVTNKRIIAKYGLISRKTIELNLSKIEGLDVNQGIIGRIFNFGDVTFGGTGGKKSPIKYIKNPLHFRKVVNEQIE